MIVQFEIKGRKTFVTYNGKTTEHNTVWLLRHLLKDLVQLLKDRNLKEIN